jgi:hypothetical protein
MKNESIEEFVTCVMGGKTHVIAVQSRTIEMVCRGVQTIINAYNCAVISNQIFPIQENTDGTVNWCAYLTFKSESFSEEDLRLVTKSFTIKN